MQAVIMAGGKGTRLQSVAKDIPKPMVEILNKPILEYQIESLKASGIKDIILIVGYLGEIIKGYFKDGTNWNVNIDYIVEDKPLGTAGALYYLKDKIKNDFILIFGDLLLDIDWNRFMEYHKSKGGIITLYGHPNTHPYDSDIIVSDSNGKVLNIEEKNAERNFYYHNFVNAGIYCLNPILFEMVKKPEKIDLEKNIIAGQIEYGTVYSYKAAEYVHDIGVPDRYYNVCKDVSNGITAIKNLMNKQKAIFFDRDGTINVLKGFLKSSDEFELFQFVPNAIKEINTSEYLAIVITNQPVVARGECTFEELEQIHMKLETELGSSGAYIDDLFYCPHHPHKGYEGEVHELKVQCECRKPKIGMFIKAAQKYNIDLSKSWYVGDTTTDIKAGINAGMRTILVHTGEGGKDRKFNVNPHFETENFLDAVNLILNLKK